MSSIIFDNVSKSFLRGTGVSTSLIEAVYSGGRQLFNKLSKKKSYKNDKLFWAMKDVSFEVKPGEAFAIVGPNGAGKSTALKLLSRVSWPTKGKITTKGKIACLIELGAGFHPELTGRENIFLYGTIMGMTKEEIKNNFDSIVEFAEFSEFLDTPLKRYSSGMRARFGFSVAIHTKPDILLVDEVLAVGDWAFRQKCYAEMENYRKQGTTIVFVSHNMGAVNRLCNKGILLEEGKITINGSSEDVINGYYEAMKNKKVLIAKSDKNYKAEMKDFRLIKDNGDSSNIFKSGDKAKFSYKVTFLEDIDNVEFGFFVHRKDNLQIISTGSTDLGHIPIAAKKGQTIRVEFPFTVNLLAGNYMVGGEVRVNRFSVYLDINIKAVNFQVAEKYSHGGVADLKPQCSIESFDQAGM